MGKHYFRYQGKFIQVERTREQMINSGVTFESVQLTAFGKDRRIYIEQARDATLLANETKAKHLSMLSPVSEVRRSSLNRDVRRCV